MGLGLVGCGVLVPLRTLFTGFGQDVAALHCLGRLALVNLAVDVAGRDASNLHERGSQVSEELLLDLLRPTCAIAAIHEVWGVAVVSGAAALGLLYEFAMHESSRGAGAAAMDVGERLGYGFSLLELH